MREGATALWYLSNTQGYGDDDMDISRDNSHNSIFFVSNSNKNDNNNSNMKSRSPRPKHKSVVKAESAHDFVIIDTPQRQRKTIKNLDIQLKHDSLRRIASIKKIYLDDDGKLFRDVEVYRRASEPLGLIIQCGDGMGGEDGIFISSVTLGSLVDEKNLIHAGDEITHVNGVDVMNKTLEEVVSMLQIEGQLILSTRCALPFDVYTDNLPPPAHTKNLRPSPKLPKTRQSPKKDLISHITPAFSPVLQPDLMFGDYRMNQDTGLVYKQSEDDTALPRLTAKIDSEGENNIFYLPKADGDTKSEREGDVRMREILDECVEIQITKSGDNISPLSNDGKENDQRKDLTDEPDGKNKDDDRAASSDSDSDLNDAPKMFDKLTKYPSDKPTANYSLENPFTGKLAVSIFTVEGASSSGSRGTYYCTLETNNEFKAKTKVKPNDMMVIFDDAFDIDVQKAKALLITLYKQRSLFADKNIATTCIVLEKVFADDYNYKKLLVSSTKGNVQTLLSIKFTDARKHLQRKVSTRKSGVFGFNLSKTLANERNTIPTLVRKCVAEIERRGLLIEGIYRISGDARVKKELREKFEENSHNVDISDEDIDCHVITGILKDYLRKLPNPLISEDMYKIMRDEKEQVGNDRVLQRKMLSKMLKIAPYVNRATLIFIMDHLLVVIKHIDNNRMTGKNVAVCFGPVLMCPPIEEMIDFQKYIDALEFLISIWPTKTKQNII